MLVAKPTSSETERTRGVPRQPEAAVRGLDVADREHEDGTLLKIDLDEIGPHPDQPRRALNEEKLKELMVSIVQAGGLLQPINVRPSLPEDSRPEDERPYRYRLIAGQRRLEAFRRLRDAATTPEERKRFAMIDARLRLGRDRADALKDALVENLQRDDLLPLDAAEALAKLKTEGGFRSAKELAVAVGQKEDRVKRLLRLNEAPEIVKAAVRTGLLVQVRAQPAADAEASPDSASVQPKREHLRRLDLMEALEFAQLHHHYVEKLSAAKKPAIAEEQATERTRKAIERALLAGWGFRRIQEHVNALIEGRAIEEKAAMGPEAAKDQPPPFKATAKDIVIHRTRLRGATGAQLDALEKELRQLLSEVETARGNVAHAS